MRPLHRPAYEAITTRTFPPNAYPLSVALFWDRLTGAQGAPPGWVDRRERRRRAADRGQPAAVAADPDRDHDRARERARGRLAAVRAAARGNPAARGHLGRDALPGQAQRSGHRADRARRVPDAAAARGGGGGAARHAPGDAAAVAVPAAARGNAAHGAQLVRGARRAARPAGRCSRSSGWPARRCAPRSPYGVAWFLLFGGVRPVVELARTRHQGDALAARAAPGDRPRGHRRPPTPTSSPG